MFSSDLTIHRAPLKSQYSAILPPPSPSTPKHHPKRHPNTHRSSYISHLLEVERLQRYYSSIDVDNVLKLQIEDILKSQSVMVQDIKADLECFDDTSFDSFSLAEVLGYPLIPYGDEISQYPLRDQQKDIISCKTAVAVKLYEQPFFRDAYVVGYNFKTKLYLVQKVAYEVWDACNASNQLF